MRYLKRPRRHALVVLDEHLPDTLSRLHRNLTVLRPVAAGGRHTIGHLTKSCLTDGSAALSVDVVSNTYSENIVAVFVSERLERADGCQTPVSEIWDEAQRWAESQGLILASRTMFEMRLAGLGFQKRKCGKSNTVCCLDARLFGLR